jgi:hypothetical protein
MHIRLGGIPPSQSFHATRVLKFVSFVTPQAVDHQQILYTLSEITFSSIFSINELFLQRYYLNGKFDNYLNRQRVAIINKHLNKVIHPLK